MKHSIILLLIALFLHPIFTDFWFNPQGECFGTLSDGTTFSQINIWEEPRIQKFCWTEDCWFVSDIGAIWAGSTLEALSIYFNSL